MCHEYSALNCKLQYYLLSHFSRDSSNLFPLRTTDRTVLYGIYYSQKAGLHLYVKSIRSKVATKSLIDFRYLSTIHKDQFS